MDDRELDARLRQGKGEADRFFSHQSIKPLRETVFRRVRRGLPPRGFRAVSLAWAAAGVAAAVVLGVLALGRVDSPDPMGLGTPVAQQEVVLDNKEAAHWVNFFRVAQPDSIRESLLAVFWAPRAGGGWQPVYSSLLEGEGEPLPISTLELPGEQRQLIIISTRDREDDYLHYRVVAYEAGRVFPYHEEDYVPRGKLEIGPGFLVERRAAPLSYSGGPGEELVVQEVKNLIPYHIDDQGEIIVPEGPLSLEVGDYLVLVGNDAGDRVKAFARGVISPAKGGFYASALGDACLMLIPDDDPGRIVYLSFKVLEPD